METLKVIKIGGNIIDDGVSLDAFLSQFSKLMGPKILVHGGGKSATRLSERMNLKVNIVDGRRITDADALDVVSMVYAGKINKTIIAKLQEKECNAIGLSGADGNSIEAIKRPVTPIDFGFVGDIIKVNNQLLKTLLGNALTPVFCALTHDANGQLLNTNADTIASEISKALAQDFNVELYYCFEKNGVLKTIDDEQSVIQYINSESYQSLKGDGTISDGMLPKLDNCFNALTNNVTKVCIGKPEMLFNTNATYTTIVK